MRIFKTPLLQFYGIICQYALTLKLKFYIYILYIYIYIVFKGSMFQAACCLHLSVQLDGDSPLLTIHSRRMVSIITSHTPNITCFFLQNRTLGIADDPSGNHLDILGRSSDLALHVLFGWVGYVIPHFKGKMCVGNYLS